MSKKKPQHKAVHLVRIPSLITMFDAIGALENNIEITSRQPSWALWNKDSEKVIFEGPEKLQMLEYAKLNGLEITSIINDVN